jgi:epoxyqueuosine reductase
MDEKDYYEDVEQWALREGASLFGVAGISALLERVRFLSPSATAGLDRAISMAFHLSERILEDIAGGPTRLYFFHYQRANIHLDELALKVTHFIQTRGWNALPIPASQIIDWQNQRAHISHKHVAVQAGLGWIGRNNLLVTPRFGSQVRLVTVLTDMPIRVDQPLGWGCGECRACIPSCPSRSIHERPEDFDHLGCFNQVKALVKAAGISQYICGLCVKPCRGENKNRIG